MKNKSFIRFFSKLTSLCRLSECRKSQHKHDGHNNTSIKCKHSKRMTNLCCDNISSCSSSLEHEKNIINLGLCDEKSSRKKYILILGDGNFSYSNLLAKKLVGIFEKSICIVATSFDNIDDIKKQYPASIGIIKELNDLCVEVKHGIDATSLSCPMFGGRKFDRIVFNFPHCYIEGKKNQIHKHRTLLNSFFQKAQDVLSDDGEVWVTLCAGQGGTLKEIKKRSYGDTWQIEECANNSDFILQNVHICPIKELLSQGYRSVGYRLQERGFYTENSLTHVFSKDCRGIEAAYPMIYSRDLSFWINKPKFCTIKFQNMVSGIIHSSVEFSCELLDDYIDNSSGKSAKTFRLQFQSRKKALNRKLVNEYCNNILDQIEVHGLGSSR